MRQGTIWAIPMPSRYISPMRPGSQGAEKSSEIILAEKLWFLKERCEEEQPLWKSTYYFVHIHVHVSFLKILTIVYLFFFQSNCLSVVQQLQFWQIIPADYLKRIKASSSLTQSPRPGTLNRVLPRCGWYWFWSLIIVLRFIRWQLNSDASQ